MSAGRYGGVRLSGERTDCVCPGTAGDAAEFRNAQLKLDITTLMFFLLLPKCREASDWPRARAVNSKRAGGLEMKVRG
jgi:hypothetical protein